MRGLPIKRLLGTLTLLLLILSGGGGTAAASAPCAGTGQKPTTILVVMLENHAFSSVDGNMPYLNSVASACTLLTHESAISHPSLPNYLADTSGSTWGITDDKGPSSHPIKGASIFSELGLNRWKQYSQSMPKNCDHGNAYPYLVHHDPADYYTNLQASQCPADAVPLAPNLANDLAAGTLPPYSFVVPDNCHNGHSNTCAGSSCPLCQADGYMQTLLPEIFASPQYQSGNLLVVVTWDEGKSTNQTVYTVLASQGVTPGLKIASTLSAYSLLRYEQATLGVACLLKSCTAPVLSGPGL